MPYEFKVPEIGEGVTQGEILKWMIREGEKILEDQPLVEIMTDKVNVQIPSPKSGTIARILVGEGEAVKVGQAIVIIREEGEANSASVGTQGEPEKDMRRQSLAPVRDQIETQSHEVLATPSTRRIARELGVDLDRTRGTGPMGRITEDDVRSASTKRIANGSSLGRFETIPIRGIRKLTADKMIKSYSTIAHVTHVDEVDVTELVILRETLRDSAAKKGVKLSFLPFFIKAIVAALKEFPYANSSLDELGETIILKKYYNIGIAVDTEQGLLVPVVKDADKKGIFELAAAIEALIAKAKSGQLALDEVRDSTFTITNVGSIGGLFASPIINYPEAAILGIYRIRKCPIIRDDKTDLRDMMYVSFTFDHRIFDGAYAARIVNRLMELIQDPRKLA